MGILISSTRSLQAVAVFTGFCLPALPCILNPKFLSIAQYGFSSIAVVQASESYIGCCYPSISRHKISPSVSTREKFAGMESARLSSGRLDIFHMLLGAGVSVCIESAKGYSAT